MKQSKVCSVDGCERRVHARGWCAPHLRRWYKHGDIDAGAPIAPKNVPVADRLWAKVDRSGGAGACWPYMGYRIGGYGQISSGKGIRRLAHRIAWELTNGSIPSGLSVCHTCDNPPCCNPAHLWLGTQSENALDAARKGRLFASITPNDAAQIRELRLQGVPGAVVANMFGVSQQTVCNIKKGRQWVHAHTDLAGAVGVSS